MDSVAIDTEWDELHQAEIEYGNLITNNKNKPSHYLVSREASQTPIRMRDRIVAQFMSRENIKYLKELLNHKVPAGALRTQAINSLEEAMHTFALKRALEVIASDPIAKRGAARPAVDFWAELRRVNRVFYEERMSVLRDYAPIIEERERKEFAIKANKNAPHITRPVIRDAQSEDNEQYHMRMFISDSLRPPGLENLNTSGPLYALLEDQQQPDGARPIKTPNCDKKEKFTHRPDSKQEMGIITTGNFPIGKLPTEYDEEYCFSGNWETGNPNRTPAQAIAEYWGDDKVATQTFVGRKEQNTDDNGDNVGRAYGDDYAWGTSWKDNGGTRFMRYETIPFWQKGGREGYEHDIEETLGTQMRESNNHVRGWDMERLRLPLSLKKYEPEEKGCAKINKYAKPPGQTYKQYGARS